MLPFIPCIRCDVAQPTFDEDFLSKELERLHIIEPLTDAQQVERCSNVFHDPRKLPHTIPEIPFVISISPPTSPPSPPASSSLEFDDLPPPEVATSATVVESVSTLEHKLKKRKGSAIRTWIKKRRIQLITMKRAGVVVNWNVFPNADQLLNMYHNADIDASYGYPEGFQRRKIKQRK